MGSVLGLPLQMEDAVRPSSSGEPKEREDQGGHVELGIRRLQSRDEGPTGDGDQSRVCQQDAGAGAQQPAHVDAAEGLQCGDGLHEGAPQSTGDGKLGGDGPIAVHDGGGAEGESSPESDPMAREGEVGDDGRVRHYGDGQDLSGGLRLSQCGDVSVCREDRSGGRSDSEGVGGVGQAAHREAGGIFHQTGAQECEEGSQQVTDEVIGSSLPLQDVWVNVRGDGMVERVEAFSECPHFSLQGVFVKDQHETFAIYDIEELAFEDECFCVLRRSQKDLVEDFVDDVEETALPKKLKNQLRRALNDAVSQRRFAVEVSGGSLPRGVDTDVGKIDACFGDGAVEVSACGSPRGEAAVAKDTYAVEVSEVYSPPRVVDMAKKFKLKTGASYDILTGYDLRMKRDLNRMWRNLQLEEPELTVISPPCTPFSPLQEWNFPRMLFEKVAVMVGEGLHHVSTSCKVAKWQHSQGRLFVFEHPKPSKAWDEPEMIELMMLPGVYVCVADQCAYGLQVGSGLNRKTTQFVTNSRHIAIELQRRCSGDHEHQPLTNGRAAKAAIYPPELCRAIIRGLKRHLREKEKHSAVFLEFPEEITVLPTENQVGHELDDFEDILPQEVAEHRRATRLAHRLQLAQRPEVAVTDEDKAKVLKMHNNLGHPALDSFVRFLRAGRVRDEVVRWALKEFRCETCASQVVPKAPRPAVVPKCYKPGVAVGMDLFYIPDPKNTRSLPVLNVVDIGTNYQVIELLEDKDPISIWRAFWACWCRVFGAPQYLAVDEGLEFRGQFTQWCSNYGILVFRAAARSPWQQGKVERHGGLMKTMIEHARAAASIESNQDLRLLLQECESAKNRFMNRSGYSPVQRQIGQWPRLPGSLMSDEFLDPALQLQNTSDEFDRLLELRRLAQEAFVELASKDAAVKSLKARSRIQRIFKAGDVVYVYRALRRRKSVRGLSAARGHGLGRKATWVGPGHVLALEGSVVWINMFGELWRASIEQTREATTMEKLGVEMVAEGFQEMQERLKRSSHRAGYRDVTQDTEELEDVPADEEGQRRGQPRVRFALQDDVTTQRGEMPLQDLPVLPAEELEESEDEQLQPQHEQRRASRVTVPEPDAEGSVREPNMAEVESVFDDHAEEETVQSMASSVQNNENLDGVPGGYEAARRAVQTRWRQRGAAPYFAEFFLQTGEAEDMEELTADEPTKDYWVYDDCRGILQRHHVHWRKALFSPAQTEGCPIPLRAIRAGRTTRRVGSDGSTQDVVDEWSLFTKKEERYTWWKGVTEFAVDRHYLQTLNGPAAKKRGEGEVFSHEIPKEEWPEWEKQDAEEFGKIISSGALKILSVEESNRVQKELKEAGQLNRILPTRMVRRYKPGDGPGAPRTKKSRFCIRGDRDPDIADLTRFAPTVTTSNLQVLIQAAMNKGFKGLVGDLKAAFTQSLPLFRSAGKLYCRSCDGSMPGLQEGQIAEIVLGCYGLCDAPMHWRKTLVQFLTSELGYRQSCLDPCTFLLHGPQGLHGMVAVEIDDLLMFGDEVHDSKMATLQKKFTFGKIQEINGEGVSFNGRRLRRFGDTMVIDMKAFVEERLSPVPLSKERAKQKQERLTDEEISEVRKTCGSLNWAGREGRPDAAAAASLFASMMVEMRVSDVLELNRVVDRLKESSELSLQIQRIAEEKMCWGVISDASWGNARGGKTQGGHMLITFDRTMLDGQRTICNLLHWKSAKLHRTVNSTLAAETQHWLEELEIFCG